MHLLKVGFVATVKESNGFFFNSNWWQCILPEHPILCHAPCVSEISVGKPVKYVSSHYASTHERLQTYKTSSVWLPVYQCRCLYVCALCIHVTLKWKFTCAVKFSVIKPNCTAQLCMMKANHSSNCFLYMLESHCQCHVLCGIHCTLGI